MDNENKDDINSSNRYYGNNYSENQRYNNGNNYAGNGNYSSVNQYGGNNGYNNGNNFTGNNAYNNGNKHGKKSYFAGLITGVIWGIARCIYIDNII